MTPAEAKDAVLRPIKEGLSEDLLVAYVRQARIRPAFSADDILGRKGAGIPSSVITVALDAAAPHQAPWRPGLLPDRKRAARPPRPTLPLRLSASVDVPPVVVRRLR